MEKAGDGGKRERPDAEVVENLGDIKKRLGVPEVVIKAASGFPFEKQDVKQLPEAAVPNYRQPWNLTREIENDVKYPEGQLHTMPQGSLDDYCKSKIFLHREVLATFFGLGYSVEVHGVYPEHMRVWAATRGWTYTEDSLLSFGKSRERIMIEDGYRRMPRKRYNTERGQWYAFPEGKRLVLAVFPGRDYTKHYGHIVRHYLVKEWGADYARNHFEGAFYYQQVIENMAEWTGLKTFVGDLRFSVVVLGYVDEFYEAFMKFERVEEEPGVEPWKNGSMYGKRVVRNALGSQVVFLGVCHSYWGETSQYIVRALYEQGAEEVLYAAKCGELRSDRFVLGLAVPSQFKIVQLGGATRVDGDITTKNSMLDWVKTSPFFDTRSISIGVHVSVPTILGESQEQYDAIQSYGANTIDNEISYMAAAVPAGRRFSACHFITDHLHSAEELERMKGDPRVRYDLAIMARRTVESQQLAERAKHRVAETVCRHLRFWAPLQTDSTAIHGCWPKYSDVDWAPYINIVQKKLIINVSYLKSWTKSNFDHLKAVFERNVDVELYLPDPTNPGIMEHLKQRFWYKGNSFDGPKNISETVALLKHVHEKAGGKGTLTEYYVPFLQSYSLYKFDERVAIQSMFSETDGQVGVPSPVILYNLEHPRIKEYFANELARLKSEALRLERERK